MLTMKENHPWMTATRYFGPAAVLETDELHDRILLSLEIDSEMTEVWAQIAIPAPLKLEQGNKVLAMGEDLDEIYVIGVLQSAPKELEKKHSLKLRGGTRAQISGLPDEQIIQIYSKKRELLFEYDEKNGKARVNMGTGDIEFISQKGNINFYAGQDILMNGKTVGITSRSQIEPLAIQILKNYPQLTIFAIADIRGNLIMAKKMSGGSIDTKVIERRDTTKQVKWIRRDRSGSVVGEESIPDDTYDARTRPWYTGAVASRSLFWTDVYIFFTDQKPGVTAAMPVIDDNGKLYGVLGADIELEELSKFFRNLSIGRNGKALIIDKQGRLVAYPQTDRMLKRIGDVLQPGMLNELGDPVLSRAYNRFKIEGHGRRILTVDKRRYLNTISSLRATVGRDWSVMIVVPEEDFIGFVKENTGRALLMTSIIVILASIMAGLLVFQGLRADRNAREILNRKQEVEDQSRAFSTLASDAAVFDPTDAESLGRGDAGCKELMPAKLISRALISIRSLI